MRETEKGSCVRKYKGGGKCEGKKWEGVVGQKKEGGCERKYKGGKGYEAISRGRKRGE